MAKKKVQINLKTEKTTKEQQRVTALMAKLKKAREEQRKVAREETDKKIMELGTNIVSHWHLETVEDLDAFLRTAKERIPETQFVTNTENDNVEMNGES